VLALPGILVYELIWLVFATGKGHLPAHLKGKVDFHFDTSRKIAPAQLEDWESAQDRAAQARARKQAALEECEEEVLVVKACGGGEQQLAEALEEPMREPA